MLRFLLVAFASLPFPRPPPLSINIHTLVSRTQLVLGLLLDTVNRTNLSSRRAILRGEDEVLEYPQSKEHVIIHGSGHRTAT